MEPKREEASAPVAETRIRERPASSEEPPTRRERREEQPRVQETATSVEKYQASRILASARSGKQNTGLLPKLARMFGGKEGMGQGADVNWANHVLSLPTNNSPTEKTKYQ